MAGRLERRRGRVNRRGAGARAMLVAALVAAPAAGAAAAQDEDLRNAATWYRRAFERLEAVPISEAQWQAVLTYMERPGGGEPPPEVRELLGRLEPVFGAVHRASRLERSDFSLDYSQGFELTLPHLGALRSVARLMSADASARLAAGDADTAAAEIMSLYRMADHVVGDEVLISSLVGRAVFEQADLVARSGIDRGAFDEARSARLLEGLERLAGDDPFSAVAALRREKTALTEWIGGKYAEIRDRADGLAALGAAGGPGELAGALLLDQAQFETALDQTGHAMDRAIEIFQLDDPAEARLELEALGRQIAAGDHGPLAWLVAPKFEFAYDRFIESRERIAVRRAQLRAIATGLVAPEQLANAALWYLEAIEALRELPPEGWQAVRDLLAEPRGEPGAMVLLTLENAAAALELLETGSRLTRCDFSIARSAPAAVPAYLPPLRDAARLLQADALRLRRGGDPAGAADRLGVAFRLSAHLAGDDLPASSLVAHAVFASTSVLMETGVLTTDEREALLSAIARTSRLDPFGHVAARRKARDEIASWLRRRAGSGAMLDEIVRRAQALDGDRLLRLLVAHEAAGEPIDPGPLDDVVVIPGIAAARDEAGSVRARLQRGDMAVLDEPVAPIARIEAPIDSARAELARALRALGDE